MNRCRKGNPRIAPRERLQFVHVDSVSTKLARDFAKHVSRVTTGEDILVVGHVALRDRLREVIRDELMQAQATA